MVIDVIKNPVIIGLIAGVLTYIFILWYYKEKIKKDPRYRRTYAIFIPIFVGVIAWIISYIYFSYNSVEVMEEINMSQTGGDIFANSLNNNIKINADTSLKELSNKIKTNKSYQVNKGLNIPDNLPDVFIENF